MAQQPKAGQSSLNVEVFLWHSLRHTHPVELLWTTDKIAAETATHTTHYKMKKRTRYPWKRTTADIRFRPHDLWDRAEASF